MDSFFKILGSVYLLFGIALLIVGGLSSPVNSLHICVFGATGIIMIKGWKYFSSISSKFFLAYLLLAPIGIFLAGFFDGDPRFGNPFMILRYALVVLTMLPVLILPVFVNGFAAKAKIRILYRALSLVILYVLSAAWFYEVYHEKGSVYFHCALLLLIPVYVMSYAINKLLTVVYLSDASKSKSKL